MDWLNVKTAPLPSLQNGQVTKSNRTYTLREFPKRFAKDRIRLHELSPFSKGQSNLCFPKKSNQNQNRERMSWTLYNSPLHCIVSYEVHIYQISKVAYICIPKHHVNCIDVLHLMSHLLEFGMTGPLNESISFFLKRVDPWVLVPSPLEGYTPSPSEDYTSSPSEGYTPSPSEDYMSSP